VTGRLALCGVLALVLLTGAVRTPAQSLPSDSLFDDSVVRDLRLFVNSLDWQKLQETFQENTYYPADLRWGDQVVRNVGIRSRGGGSRDANKPGLRVDFNRYAAGQELLGLESVVLDNARQDPSFIRERLSMLLFARMGLPAPRETHVRLYVNNDLIGLYVLVESIDKDFLARSFGEAAPGNTENDGYLFEFEYAGEWHFEYFGSDLASYERFFDPVTHERAPAEELYRAFEELTRIVNEAPDDQFQESAGRFIDLGRFMRHLAVESYLAEHDGFLGYAGMNNFYIYRFEGRTVAQLLPWDKDHAFFSLDRYYLENADLNVLVRRALRIPELRNVFESALRECAALASELAADSPPGATGPGWLAREIERLVILIRPAALEDARKAFSNERFEEDVAFLVDFANERGARVLSDLARGATLRRLGRTTRTDR
jgi:hypothetical protein